MAAATGKESLDTVQENMEATKHVACNVDVCPVRSDHVIIRSNSRYAHVIIRAIDMLTCVHVVGF